MWIQGHAAQDGSSSFLWTLDRLGPFGGLEQSGTLLTLLFDWIPKPCAAPLLLRWCPLRPKGQKDPTSTIGSLKVSKSLKLTWRYGSYFPHIVTAAVSRQALKTLKDLR